MNDEPSKIEADDCFHNCLLQESVWITEVAITGILAELPEEERRSIA